MLPSLLIAATITAPGAPTPKETLPAPTGPAPRILAVKANGAGIIWIVATIFEKRKIQQQIIVNENGKQVVKQQQQEIMTSTYIQKSLGDFGGKFTTADGSVLTAEQAAKRVKDGATILITTDGKPIDSSWLKAVSGDTIIMVTDELSHAYFQHGHSSLPSTPAPRLVMLGTDDKGAVRLAVNANGDSNQGFYDDIGGFNGGLRVMRGNGRMVVINGNIMPLEMDGSAAPPTKPAGPDGKKALEDIRFDAYDLTGKLIPKSEALKRLKAGGLVLFAGDNRFPDSEYLKGFHQDLIVLVSSELTFQPGQSNPYDLPVKSSDAAPVKRLVAPAPPLAPAVAPVPAIQIQFAPAVVVQKAVPIAPPPAPKEAPAEKPAEKPAAKPAEKPAKP